jgi:Uma2 family endonuclease
MLILDSYTEERLKAEREESGADRMDEVWEGVYIVSPLPNNEHQSLASRLHFVIFSVIGLDGGGTVFQQVNVSDREEGWMSNYRQPDVAVILEGGRARDCGTHWVGGPDFIVEILSPDDHAREKIPFYAKVGVRELLLIDRDPWALELYRLRRGRLVRVGRVEPGQDRALTSEVLPLRFRLLAGGKRPSIEVVHQDDQRRWTI